MRIMPEKTILQKYFKKNKLKVKHVAPLLHTVDRHLYKILQGTIRPQKLLADRIFAFTKGEIPYLEIRKPLVRPRCPCCERTLRKHHVAKLKAKDNKKRKEEIPIQPEKVEKKPRESLPSLLDI